MAYDLHIGPTANFEVEGWEEHDGFVLLAKGDREADKWAVYRRNHGDNMPDRGLAMWIANFDSHEAASAEAERLAKINRMEALLNGPNAHHD